MKLIAFAGSNSSTSINKRLVSLTLKQLQEFDSKLLDLNQFEMPVYSIDREKSGGIPDQAIRFRQYMQEPDGIVCSLAEHNNSYTVAFKNVLDWCSRVDLNIFAGKPMLLMSTSPGGYGGGNVMKAAESFLPKCGAKIAGTFSLPKFYDNFDDSDIKDENLKNQWLKKIESFRNSVIDN